MLSAFAASQRAVRAQKVGRFRVLMTVEYAQLASQQRGQQLNRGALERARRGISNACLVGVRR